MTYWPSDEKRTPREFEGARIGQRVAQGVTGWVVFLVVWGLACLVFAL
jgi:hypothetical protein